jgi:hypothetical protein
MRSISVAVVLGTSFLSVGLLGCSKSEKSEDPAQAASAVEEGKSGSGRAEGLVTAQAEEREDARAHLDLLNLAHLADVDHEGLFIDFGTPARMKYTIGHWKTGWGSDRIEGDTTFTYVGATTGRVYFPLERVEPLTLRLRVKPYGSRNLMLFVNNKQLPAVVLDKGKDFADYDVAVPAEHGRLHRTGRQPRRHPLDPPPAAEEPFPLDPYEPHQPDPPPFEPARCACRATSTTTTPTSTGRSTS